MLRGKRNILLRTMRNGFRRATIIFWCTRTIKKSGDLGGCPEARRWMSGIVTLIATRKGRGNQRRSTPNEQVVKKSKHFLIRSKMEWFGLLHAEHLRDFRQISLRKWMKITKSGSG